MDQDPIRPLALRNKGDRTHTHTGLLSLSQPSPSGRPMSVKTQEPVIKMKPSKPSGSHLVQVSLPIYNLAEQFVPAGLEVLKIKTSLPTTLFPSSVCVREANSVLIPQLLPLHRLRVHLHPFLCSFARSYPKVCHEHLTFMKP